MQWSVRGGGPHHSLPPRRGRGRLPALRIGGGSLGGRRWEGLGCYRAATSARRFDPSADTQLRVCQPGAPSSPCVRAGWRRSTPAHSHARDRTHSGPAMRHAQRGVDLAQVLECALSCRQARNASFQLGDVAAHLRIAPLLVCIANDSPQIGFRCIREQISRQLRRLPLNSSSRMSSTRLLDTFPAKPSLMRAPSRAFSSCQA